ncbi:MAG: FMN-binding negative transcriptional regulator, partial [Chloroflexota bacterium]
MLIHRHDAPLDDAEWRAFLREHDFGELIAPGAGRDLPIVVPTHFIWDGDREVLLHLARPNPVWDALAERPRALLSVFGAYTYIPGHWNQDEYGVPTSYYAAVQLACDAMVVDDPARI